MVETRTAASVDLHAQMLDDLQENLRKVIQGKDDVLAVVAIAVAANGSLLIDDVPGVGKTTLAKALAQSIQAEFHRIQFTPDLLPADILGSSVYNPVDGTFTFHEGPVFCNVLLADEINRASPRTQSALLEAMNEGQATIEGTRYPLPQPFFVLATQNPVEFHGTYPLPEAQLDRFLVQLSIGYPEPEVEADILYAQALSHPIDQLKPVLSREDVLSLQRAVRNIQVERSVAEYMVELVSATRIDPRLKLGVSPRGGLMLFRASQSAALAAGRDFVMPDDVQSMAPYVLSHRVMLASKAKYGGTTKQEVLDDILGQVRVPT